MSYWVPYDVEQAQEAYQDLVQRKRKDQGEHECEILGCRSKVFEGSKQYENCSKNRGHLNFIPASQFSKEHLPVHLRFQSVFDLIQSYVARTVQLEVCYTSSGRPYLYPFHRSRGRHDPPHHGSGYLYNISIGEGLCPCQECLKNSDISKPCPSWWSVDLFTACHVIYDADEARSTTVTFFNDNENSVNECRVKTLQGAEVIARSPKSDWCRFRCATHDKDLAMQLKTLLLPKDEVWEIKPLEANVEGKPCFVISHPHAQPKKVTVGEVRGLKTSGKTNVSFAYTTDTCPGSSGAPVLVLQDDIGLGLEKEVSAYWTFPHRKFDKELQQNVGAEAIELIT